MINIVDNVYRIDSKDEFLKKCSIAYEAINFSETHGEKVNVKWFFSECYANWKESSFTVIFISYRLPEYKNHLLSVQVVSENKDDITFKVLKETTGV